ncbi:MAG: hypothetical protein AAF675_04370 [Pseudomonadota bacterium]
MMPPHVADFVATWGYGPFVAVALLMTAILARTRGGQDSATIVLVCLTLPLLFGLIILPYYDYAFLHAAFVDDQMRKSSVGSSFRRAGGDPDAVEASYLTYVPITLGLVYAILLPPRLKILGPVGAGLWIVLWYNGTLQFSSHENQVAEIGGAVTEHWLAERLASIRAAVLLLLDVLSGGGSEDGVDGQE